MIRSIIAVAAAAGLLAVGAMTVVAGNSHGKSVSTLAKSTTLKGEAKGDAISTLASANGEAKSDAAKADAKADKAARAAADPGVEGTEGVADGSAREAAS